MKFYELTYLTSSEFTKDEVVNYHEKIKTTILNTYDSMVLSLPIRIVSFSLDTFIN